MERIRSCQPILLTVFCVLLPACAPKTPTLPKLAPDAVIVAFGDSLTYGSGANPNENYPAVLQALTGRTVINAGVPSEVSEAGLQRLPEVLDRQHPALLILCHGGNDLLRRLDRQHISDDLRAMIQLARQRGVAVMLIGVPEPKLLWRDTAPLYTELAEQLHVPIETEALRKIESDTALKSDAVHPNAAGYRQLAEAVRALLQRAGAL